MFYIKDHYFFVIHYTLFHKLKDLSNIFNEDNLLHIVII